ncbi:solute carrier family 66 member 3 isoform X1 [Plodia interpunctella]|nr:solute carrier family 66 member 3 isoform X1 [Plodia interpunctella]
MAVDQEVMQSMANALSTLTILSCLFLKVPQILYIWKRKSAEGIFLQAMVMEVFGFSIMTLYNYTNQYSLMTYLEYPIILVQVYVMFYLVLKYQNKLKMPIVPIGTMAYCLGVFGFVLNILPKEILSFIVPFCTPLSGFAKVTYIYGIINAGNADAISLTTWIISVATNLARIFTVFVDSADKCLMMNFIISTMLSSGVLATALYYQQQSAPSYQPRRKSACRHRHSHSHND